MLTIKLGCIALALMAALIAPVHAQRYPVK